VVNEPGKPFLKWTGGKRWLVPRLDNEIPREYNRYFEPFLGGGALFFYLNPWPATLSDSNKDLINVYKQVRDNLDPLISRLNKLRISKNSFLEMRKSKPRTALNRAVRFLYLNKTAFNGIYRVNQKGEFNVPFGCKPKTRLVDRTLLEDASSTLQNRTLRACDFQDSVDQAMENDFVYVDPPYTTKHDNNGFRRYNEVIFSWDDQVRLAACCNKAVERGAHVVVSNANHSPVIQLYNNQFTKTVLQRGSSISGRSSSRGRTTECLLVAKR